MYLRISRVTYDLKKWRTENCSSIQKVPGHLAKFMELLLFSHAFKFFNHGDRMDPQNLIYVTRYLKYINVEYSKELGKKKARIHRFMVKNTVTTDNIGTDRNRYKLEINYLVTVFL